MLPFALKARQRLRSRAFQPFERGLADELKNGQNVLLW
jgi:hypothetical protein